MLDSTGAIVSHVHPEQLLGLDYTEAKLLGYAYAFEQASGLRKLPKSTPALPNEP